MKRIHSSARIFPRRLAVVSAAFFASAVLFSSCSFFAYKRPFADAYYENNFIANIGFDKFVGSSTTVPATAETGSWDSAYRYVESWSSNSVHYIKVTDTGHTANYYDSADGLSASAKVFQLEKMNLITDGDFEGGAGTWQTLSTTSPYGSVTDTSSVATYVTSGINGKSMGLTLGSSTSNLFYSMTAASLIAGLSYDIDFRWFSTDGIPTNSAICVNSKETVPFVFNDATGHATSSFEALSPATGNKLQFRSATWNGTIDDITIRKSGSQQIRLLLKKSDTIPNLEDFLYIFSLWVHADPSVGITSSPYNLDKMSLKMYQVDGSSIMSPDTTNATYTYSSTQAGWQKIYVRVNNGNLQINSTATGAVLQLIIDLDNALPGRVLIAQPELRAYPDGY